MTRSGIISDDSHTLVYRCACTHTTYVLSSCTAPEAILLQAEGQRLWQWHWHWHSHGSG